MLLWFCFTQRLLKAKAKIPLVCNANVNDKCEQRMRSGGQCSFPLQVACATLQWLWVFHLIKHSHSDRSLHAAIHFVTFTVHISIQTNGITPMPILCARYFVVFTFVICLRIMHKWNLSLNCNRSGKRCCICTDTGWTGRLNWTGSCTRWILPLSSSHRIRLNRVDLSRVCTRVCCHHSIRRVNLSMTTRKHHYLWRGGEKKLIIKKFKNFKILFN